MDVVRPISPIAGYVGGKRQLAKRLIARIEMTPHDLYAEAFVGMGGVFFRRPSRPKVEVINDLSRDVATCFRVIQRHFQALIDMLRWQVASRSEFERKPMWRDFAPETARILTAFLSEVRAESAAEAAWLDKLKAAARPT